MGGTRGDGRKVFGAPLSLRRAAIGLCRLPRKFGLMKTQAQTKRSDSSSPGGSEVNEL
jgi:hypothetical protein